MTREAGAMSTSKTVVIDPVTRIEGHAKITLRLNDAGEVVEARFHVAEFRGFEKFCEGRPFAEMPGLTARVCGICPVSHLLVSAKTGDGLLAVTPPPAAVKLRRLMNLGQIVQSHALSFFHMSAPDLLLGWDAPPATRNLMGLIRDEPEIARGGIRLRQLGQEIIQHLGGDKIHPAWAIPGGVRGGLEPERAEAIRARLPEAVSVTRECLRRLKRLHEEQREEVETFGRFPSLFLGLVGRDGTWEHHDGILRLTASDGTIVEDDIDPLRYMDLIAERVEPDSYLKSPYYRRLGPEGGMYRVGPLARLNICSRMGTPLADAELEEFRAAGSLAAEGTFLYHQARLIEILCSLELIGEAIEDKSLAEGPFRASAGVNRRESVGVGEAPRGTLFHHYRIDGNGKLEYVNMIIATGQNNLAMNRTVAQLAGRHLSGRTVTEPVLNRIEAGIRAFDPCLSCSTHATGRMPLTVRLTGPDGETLHELSRG